MAEKSAQRHTRASTPTAHHHASPEDDTASQKKQPRWLVTTLANLLCLVVAGMYVWSTHDLIGFIILYGIATGAINAREVIGAYLPKHLPEPTSREHKSQDLND